MTQKKSTESLVRDIKQNTRRKFSSEEKVRIVIEGLRGETSIEQKRYYIGITDPTVRRIVAL